MASPHPSPPKFAAILAVLLRNAVQTADAGNGYLKPGAKLRLPRAPQACLQRL
jgi:hypothetical protein